MPNSKNRKTVSFTVPRDFPYSGAQIKKILDAFFVHCAQNGAYGVMKKFSCNVRLHGDADETTFDFEDVQKIVEGWD